jgi:phosphate transport system ATP-binding protein
METAQKIIENISENKIHQHYISISNLNVSFGSQHILKNISLNFQKNKVNCIVGPSGGGKSTLLRSINRINNDDYNLIINGSILFNNEEILIKNKDLTKLRKEIGMVFQSPCVFPKSIKENVLFGIENHSKLSQAEKDSIVEENLKAASLWDEVSTRLNESAKSLSIGQQQRLCIARTLAVKPKILLMDEPTSSLDPISTEAIEVLMNRLKAEYTIILVTHNISQVKRIADELYFICEGELIESGSKDVLFSNPKKEQTRTYLFNGTCNC